MVAEAQIRNDFRAQHAGDIRCGGDAAAGGNFFGDTAAADDLPPLEHEGGESGTGQIGGGGQAIMTTTDNDRIIGLRRLDFFALSFFASNFRRLYHVMTYDHNIRLKSSLHYRISLQNRIEIQL